MAPRKKYQCSVIVFDVNSGETFKQEALKCYLSICGDKYFSKNSDCSQLILINTSETENKKHDENESKYHNIVEATGMVRYNPKNIRYIEEAVPAQGNWIEGVQVAVEELLTSSESVAFDVFQLIVFSDLTTPMNMDNKDIDKAVKSIRKQLCQIDGYIYFLGPNISVPYMLCTKKDVYDWMQSIEVNDEHVNLKIASSILQEYMGDVCMGVICDLTVGVELVQSYKDSKNGFPFIEPLKFRDLEICTSCVKYLNCDSLLNPRRDKDEMTQPVYAYAENISEEVSSDNIIKGFASHDKLVIVPEDVDKGIKEYSRFFKLLGFTDATNVPEDYMFASTNLISVYDTKDPEIGALNYIIQACHNLGKYGIALRAYKKNTRPKLYCLIPKLEPLCFIAVEIPYAEDIDNLYEMKDCSTIKFKGDGYAEYDNVSELKDDIYAYLDSVNMHGKVKVHPNMRESCGKRKITNNLLRKIKGEDIIKTPLLLGDLRIEPEEGLYSAVNRNWFSKNDTSSNNTA